MKQIRRRLTFANVVACLALFVALGGASYAATQLPKNSVGSKQIKKNAVNSSKVKNHSLKAVDFKAGQLPAGPKGATGATGPAGPQGDTGPAGTALAYATIEAGGAVDSARSKGITSANVTHPSTGLYCIKGLSFDVHDVMATSQFIHRGINAYAGVFPGCPSGTQASIETWEGTTAEDVPFAVMLN